MNVVTERNTEKLVESLPGRHEFRLVAEVPFPKDTGLVTDTFQDFSDSDFVGIQAFFIARQKHAKIGTFGHIDTPGVTPRHQSSPGRRANRCSYIKAEQPRSFHSHLIDARCADVCSAVATEVAVALVIGKDDDKVGFSCVPQPE